MTSPETPVRSRAWPVFVVVPAALLVATILAGTLLAIATLVQSGDVDERRMQELMRTPLGLSLVVVPAQMGFLAAAVCAAFLSPLGARRRLALGTPRISIVACALLVVGTLGIQGLIQLLSPLLGEPSDHLVELSRSLASGTGAGAVFVVVIASVLPGVCEEFLFRGYAQSRLVERFGAPIAILVCSALFALAHFDPQHVIAVFPLGIWLGVTAWLAGSVWPAVLGHVLNNAFAIVLLQLSDPNADPMAPPETWAYVLHAAALLAGVAGVLIATRSVRRERARSTLQDETAPRV